MEFRRGGHRGERRRRVLIDEPAASEPTGKSQPAQRRSATATPATGPVQRYSDAALSPHQPQVTDLIPTRRWSNLVLLMLLLACAAGIEALYGYLALGHTPYDVALFPAIDLGTRGNVATWFSSSLLATCGLFGLLTYQIRRHRTDDYRGRYRMWCWLVPLFMLASIDQVAGFQESVRAALLHIGGIPEYADAQLVWVASIALMAGAVGGRLIIEMRSCRLASLMLLISLAGLATVGATQLGWLWSDASVFRVMAISGLTMGAHIALLMAILLYARFVYRDASGQVPVRRTRKRKAKSRQSAVGVEDDDQKETTATRSRRAKVSRQSGGEVIRTDPPHSQPSKVGAGSKRVLGKNTTAGDRSEVAESAESSDAGGRRSRKEKRRVVAATATAQRSTPQSPTANAAPVQKTRASKVTTGKSALTKSAVRNAASLCELDDDQLDDQPRKLSKAERKRLRKQRRKERQD